MPEHQTPVSFDRPDGSDLVYASEPGGQNSLAYRVSTSGGASVPLTFTGLVDVQDPSYSPDGKSLAFSGSP